MLYWICCFLSWLSLHRLWIKKLDLVGPVDNRPSILTNPSYYFAYFRGGPPDSVQNSGGGLWGLN